MFQVYSLEQQIQQRMQAQKVPGLALAIVKDEEIIYARGFGVTSVEADSGLSVTPQTLFLIGSTAKPLTGTAIMRLVEAGKLDLDLPVHAYVDWLRFHKEGTEKLITLRMLMSHTAGLHSSVDEFGRRDSGALAAYVREQIPQRLFVASPGKVYFYSNDGLIVAGYIAEVVSGQYFPDLMQQLVFDPLEMSRTTYDTTIAMTYPLAQEHDWLEDGTVRILHRFVDNMAGSPAGPAPMSTVLDLANFAILHLNQGKFHGKQMLTPESVKAMHTQHVAFHTVNDAGYGLTFRMEMYKGKHLLWHNGLARATTSIFCLVPEERIGIIMLFNGLFASFGAPGIVYALIDQLLNLSEQTPEPQFVEPDTTLWTRYTGTFLGVRGGLATIEHEDNYLQLDFNGNKLPMRALRSDLYVGLNEQGGIRVSVGFLPEDEGPVQWITVNGFPMQRFERDTTFVPDPAKWQTYVGTYEADNDTLKVRIESGHLLLLDVKDKHEVKCIPLADTRFACSLGLIEFVLAEDGTVSEIRSAETFHYARVK
ncbi:MAG: serine hydrolase domain-containing protein [Ktedonobacteraceae bacterium]